MTPKLWVDYTNHRGERRWREIAKFCTGEQIIRRRYPPNGGDATRELLTISVLLADRDEPRTLALSSCHGFFEGDAAALQVHTSTAGNELDELKARHEAAIERLEVVGKENDRRRTEIATLHGQLTEAEDELKEVLPKIIDGTAKLDEVRAELKSRDRQLTTGAEQYEGLRELKDRRENEIVILKGRLNTAQASLQSQSVTIREHGETIARLTRALTEAEKGGYTPVIQARVSELEAQVKALREKLPAHVEVILKATDELKDDLHDIIGGIADRVEALEGGKAKAEPKAEPKAKAEADDCTCPACELRRLLESGGGSSLGKLWAGLLGNMPTTEAERLNKLVDSWGDDKPQGYEATGRNPMYEGHFDDDPAMLAQAKGEITALSKDNGPGATVGMGLYSAGRLVVMAGRLSLSELRQANAKRQMEWDRAGKLEGNLGAIYRANELAGEVGEACNIVKKLVREQLGIDGSRTTLEALAEEMADVVISLDLLAMHYGINLGPAVREKFNATSTKMKLETRL